MLLRDLVRGKGGHTANPSLHAIPYTRHSRPVEHWPQRTPHAKTSSCNDREGDMISRADATGQADEDGSNEVADPDADP